MDANALKKMAAEAALKYVEDDTVVGVGTGSTVNYFIEALATKPSLKVALVATHREVQLVQQYIEALARLKKANLRSFTDEAAALAWLVTPLPAAKRPRARPRTR